MKIAQYKAYDSTIIIEADDWHEKQAHFVRLSEIVDVTFTPLPLEVTIPRELAVLDEMERALTEKHTREVAAIQSKRRDLLALAPPTLVEKAHAV